jgi:hypothetical protein
MKMSEYYHWRAQTYSLLVKGLGRNTQSKLVAKYMTDQAGAIAKKIRQLLRPYETGESPTMRRDLHNIVACAGLLDLDFRRQKADFRVVARLHSNTQGRNQFDAELMETLETTNTSKQIVDVVVEPALIRWGDVDGENYHERKVLVKANVYCARLRKDKGRDFVPNRRPEQRTGSKPASHYGRAPRRVR